MAAMVHTHQTSADFEADCQSAWNCVRTTTSDRISSAEELKYVGCSLIFVDHDCESAVAPASLRAALRCVGRNPTSLRVEQYWSQHGGRGGEGLGYEQFKAIMRRERPTSRDDLVRAFARLDRNGDGYITADELMKVVTKRGERMSEDDVKKIIAEADQNGDGKLDYAEFCSMIVSTAEESSRLCMSRPSSTHRAGKGGSHERGSKDGAAKEDGNEQVGLVPGSGGQGEGFNVQSGQKKGENKSSASLQSSSWRSISLSSPKTSTEGQVKDTPTETGEPPMDKGSVNNSSGQEPAPVKDTAGNSSSPLCSVELTPKPQQASSPSSSRDSKPGQLDKKCEGEKGAEMEAKKEEEEVTQANSEVSLPLLDPPKKIDHKQAGLSSSSERSLQPPSSEAPLGSKSASQLGKANGADILLKGDAPTQNSAPEQSGEEQEKEALDLKARTPSSLASSSARSLRPTTGMTLPPLTSQSSSAVTRGDLGSGIDALQSKEKGSGNGRPGKGRRSSADRSVAGQKGKLKGELVAVKSEQNLTAADSHCETGALSSQSMSGISKVKFEGRDALAGGGEGRGKERDGLTPGEKHKTEATTEAEDPPPPSPVKSKDEVPLSSGLSSASVKLLPSAKQASLLSSRSDSQMGAGSDVPFITVRAEEGDAVAPGKVGNQPANGDLESVRPEARHGEVLAPQKRGDKGATQLAPPQDLTRGESPAATLSSALSPISSSDSLPTVTDNSGLLTESQRSEDSGTGGRNSSWVEGSLPLGIVYHPPVLTPPQGVKSWHTISARGCFYLSEEKGENPVIKCHNYKLNLPSATTVWIEISRSAEVTLPVDVSLFVFKMDTEGHPTDLLTFTQHCIKQRWACMVDLTKGSYALVPYTTGCRLKVEEEGEGEGSVDLISKNGSEVTLTEQCKTALSEIYHRIDLDGNGAISRTEFDFFQESVNDEVCDDDAWQVVRENFDMNSSDEITLKGFYSLHTLTAAESEGGVEELRAILAAMGYDRKLRLRHGCPFFMDIHSEMCEAELEIVDVLPCSDTVDPALCKLGVAKGVSVDPKGCDDGSAVGHAYTLPHWAMVVVENKSQHSVNVQLDCSRSENCSSNRDSSVHVQGIEGGTSKLVYHLMKETDDSDWQPHCVISLIKQ